MDDDAFDRWTRQVEDPTSRRTALLRLVGGGLAAVGSGIGGAAAKRKRRRKKRCKRPTFRCGKRKCCTCSAENFACGDAPIKCGDRKGPLCECWQKATGGFICTKSQQVCPAASECATDAECPGTQVCLAVGRDIGCGCGEGAFFGICASSCAD
jgi:hypothetical protein